MTERCEPIAASTCERANRKPSVTCGRWPSGIVARCAESSNGEHPSQTRRGAAPELSVVDWLGLFFMTYAECQLDDYAFGPDDGMGQSDPEEYMHLSDEELRKECATARDAKIISIRNWSHALSKKQRWCLALWCAKRDDREMQRALCPNQPLIKKKKMKSKLRRNTIKNYKINEYN